MATSIAVSDETRDQLQIMKRERGFSSVDELLREMMVEFDVPSVTRLFAAANGGFYHNHTLGVHQVDQIARIPGTLLQQYNRDPNCPRVSEALRDNPVLRERILEAARITPIYLDQVERHELADLKPYLPEGRWILEVQCAPGEGDEVLEELGIS